ncbi:MAG: type I restriction enzyme EcoKI subunit R [Candidatus Methanofastidiosum methylothiophilum]|uniref:Type I restriction enzyme EcoKI subunit R n=1 Tax=Candidatus Methanofastidiosum methylothiophilum TaxID=1705564 RepID=A0A150IQZ9_9EURY|nr:MAG: type I restriction enzyme EcoKI subunit R [Candidatus Methanofastidiosum methylthiophilus]
MPKKITDRQFELRAWQSEAYRKLVEKVNNGEKDFLCVATPGAGKTKFALRVAHQFLNKNLAERVVIVAPTDSLKRQWASEASIFSGIDIDPDFTNANGIETNDFHGIAITYALLGQDKKSIHAQNTFNKKTLVIFDEVHHCGNKEHLTWGIAVRKSFQDAVFRLSISGTAFRSDDAPIPYVNYDSNRTSIADYTYSYERAILENVCRPVFFTTYDGTMKWKVGSSEFEHTFKDYLTPDQESKRLKTALDPKGNWVKDVITAADKKLTEIRKTHPEAAAMVFGATQSHAKEIAKVLEELTGELPPVIVSSEGDGSDKILNFRNSRERWLVSVKMVSEGVDIPRLRLGVYLTIVKAELFFRQAVGRFVRVLKGLQYQDAFIYIPQDKDLVKLAESIQEERDHALDKADKSKPSAGSSYNLFNDYTPALTGQFIPIGSEALEGKTISVSVEISNGARHSTDSRKAFEDNPVYLQKEQLRNELNLLAKRFAVKIRSNEKERPDFKALHKKYLEQGGKPMEQQTIEELKQRKTFYIKQLGSN